MKVPIAFALILLLSGSSAALAQDVRFNFDKQAAFGGFKTYRWVALKGAQPLSDLTDRQIKAAIDVELTKKGLTPVDGSGPADLLIGYQAAVDTEKQFTSYDTGWGYGPGWYGGGWYGHGGGGMTTGSTSTIYVGQLALDMYSGEPAESDLARRRQQDARSERQAGQAAEESREGRRRSCSRTTRRRSRSK